MTAKRKRRVMKDFEIHEISLVDNPAQPHAKITIMKRAEEQVAKGGALTTAVDGHSHVVPMYNYDGVKSFGETSWQNGHSHPWVRVGEDQIEIGEAAGHTHGVSAISKNLTEEPAPAGSKDSDSAGANFPGDAMNPEELQKALEKAQRELQEATERANTAEVVATFTDAQRSLYAKMKQEDKSGFVAMKPEDREALVQQNLAKAADSNPVIYTDRKGRTYRKNDDQRFVDMAREADESAVEAEKARELAKASDIRKAASDLQHLPGAPQDREAIVEAIFNLPEEKRETALKALKAQNDNFGRLFKQLGTKVGPEKDSPDAKIDAIAKTIRAQNPSLTEQQAYSKALATEEGKELYNQLQAKA